MSVGYWETLVSSIVDSAAITAVGPTSFFLTTALGGKYPMAGGTLRVRDALHLRASGRISCAVTTPGTARFRLLYGAAVIMDTQAIPLNIVVQTTQPWVLDMEGIVRIEGQVAQMFWEGTFASQAVIGGGTQGAATGTPTVATLPWNQAPALCTAFDATAAQNIDFDFTQTASTGSITLHNYVLSRKTSTGF
jgi:hypothetical protein